jgi:hypothetical protein
VDNIAQDTKLHQSGQHSIRQKAASKELFRSSEMNGQKPPTEDDSSVPTSEAAGYGKTKMKMERPRAP